MEVTKDDLELATLCGSFYDNPLGFVLFAFPWTSDPSLQMVRLPAPYDLIYDSEFGPDKWACDYLVELGALVKSRNFDGHHAVEAIRMATASGHGIGKSAMTSWLVAWLMSCHPYANGVVTANTSPQLATKTWSEISKWMGKCITRHWFDVTTGRGSMAMKHKIYPDSWKTVALTCDEHNSESFAGLHSAGGTPFYLFDEASAVPDKIFEVAEGALTDGSPCFFLFGNPTRNSGAFYQCFNGKNKHRWHTRQIDSRDVEITNKTQLAQWELDHGKDSDFFKVRVRGMFPSMSAKQFISVADADAALGKHLKDEQYNFAPTILTCDPAWEGDDELVIGKRQGLAFSILSVIGKNDNDIEIANILARLEDEHKADMVCVDMGYGTGILSAGHTMGRDWLQVNFGAGSNDPGCLNKRAEMWNAMKQWLKAGGAIPDDKVLYNDLIGPETVPRMDGKIQLESKSDMKKRGVPSPGRGDALALSFAYPATKKSHRSQSTRQQALDYDPMASVVRSALSSGPRDYDPLARIN
jgi:hypothetical protein